MAGVVGALLVAAWLMFSTFIDSLVGSGIVKMLDDVDLDAGEYALILDDFVTGRGPRMIVGNAALAELEDRLWYDNPVHFGSVATQGVFSLMGMPRVQEIGSLVRDGITIRTFDCLSVNCINWPTFDDAESVWGLGGFRQEAGRIGSPVRAVTNHFMRYDDYVEAHANAADDPSLIFAEIGAEILLPPDDGLRTVTLVLPTEILPLAYTSEPQGDAEQDLTRQAQGWIAGHDAEIASLTISQTLPFWLRRNGETVYDDDGLVAVRDVSYISRVIHFSVASADANAVVSDLRALDFPPPDTSLLAEPIARTFQDQGFDTACLPACGSIDNTLLIDSTDVYRQPEPSWTLRLWEIRG